MLEPWLKIGDAQLAFGAPGYLPLALGALALLALAVATHLRRRAAYREGRIASTRGVRLWLATGLRIAAFLCAVGALAQATLVEVQREDRLTVVAALDRSDSMSESESDWMHDWVERLVGAMRRDDELAVLAFGREPSLVSGPGKPALPESDAEPDIDGTASNLMAAVESGASLAGPNGVVVLLSDGNETAGDVAAAAESARRRGVRIFPVVPTRKQAPLTIENVDAPTAVRTGRVLRLAVAVANRGTAPERATLVARQGDRELGRLPVQVEPGRSVVEVEIPAGTPGHYTINVDLEGERGVASARAAKSVGMSVLGPPRVLLVSHSQALAPLLEAAGMTVTRRDGLDGLGEAELGRYHAVVLGDVTREDLPTAGQAALERYVRDGGGGLVLAASRGLVSDQAMRNTPLARILPVGIEQQKPKKRARASLALFLIIDRSSSMSYGIKLDEAKPTRMAYAREAALALLSQLGDRDQVGAAAFDTETSLLAPLRPLSQNRLILSDLISRLVPSGGTDFKEALEIGARQLIASGSSTRHIILLTDGASIRPAHEHEALIEALARSGVTVTSIRIGDDRDSFELIKDIARRTRGSFYHVADAVSLPNLMIADTHRQAGRTRSARAEEEEDREDEEASKRDVPFRPRVARAAEALGGLRSSDLPELRELAAVPLKPGAEQWLVTESGGKNAPVLAGWQTGLGRVAVFTANPSQEWQSWNHVQRFWSQLVHWAARPASGDEVRMALRRDGDRTVLSLQTFDSNDDREPVVRITQRDGAVRELRATTVGLRQYEVALPPLASIERRIEIDRRGAGRGAAREEWLPAEPEGGVAETEDPEAEANGALLSQVAEITGGALDASLEEVLRRAPAERQLADPLAPMLTLATLLLLLGDVAIRGVWR